jgi:hypothetical protein
MMLLVVILFGYGVIFGSFINALVWRLREQGKGRRAKGGEQRAKSKEQGAKPFNTAREKYVPRLPSYACGKRPCAGTQLAEPSGSVPLL